MDHTIPAVVLDLSANGIGIIRSLYKQGISIYAFDIEKKYRIGKTLHAKCHPCPDPVIEEEKLIALLINLSQKLHTKPVIYAGSDEFVLFLSKNRDILKRHFHFLMPEHELIETVLDKRLTAKLVRDYNIPSPKSVVINGEQLPDNLLSDIEYPCILKPVHGHEFRKYLSKKAIIIVSEAQLKKQLPTLRQFGELIIQEIIPGDDDAIYQVGTLFSEEMELTGLFMGQKLNQFPPYFGAGALVKSIRNEEVIEKGVTLLKSLHLTGISVAEFKRDSRDGQLKFIEINARPWLWHSLSNASGINITYLYYLLVTGQQPEKRLIQEEGIKWIYSIRDYLSTKEKVKNNNTTWHEWWKNKKGKKEHALFRWDDPMPFIRSAVTHLINAYKNKRKIKKLNID